MSDLISRSELLKALRDRASENAILGYFTAYDVTNSIIEDVEEQPTAYDTDKVIFELEKELSLADKENERCAGESHLQFDSAKGYASGISTAIEIVKSGSDVTETKTIRDKATEWNNHSSKKVPYEFIDFVEGKREIAKDDDVCKWLEDAYGRWHTQCNILADNSPLEYTYCPYCGKKIKVVD